MPVAEHPGLARHLSPPDPKPLDPAPVLSGDLWEDWASEAFADAARGETEWPGELSLNLHPAERPPESIRFSVRPDAGTPPDRFVAANRRLRNVGLASPVARYWAYDVREVR